LNSCEFGRIQDSSCLGSQSTSKESALLENLRTLNEIEALLHRTIIPAKLAPREQSPATAISLHPSIWKIRLSHGALMGIVFLGIYPLAAIMMRVCQFHYEIWVHAAIQGFAMLLMYVGMGLGQWFASYEGNIYDAETPGSYAHKRIGTVIPCLMALQPIFGYLNHRLYLQRGERTALSYVHINFGRILILLGAINGFFGQGNRGPDYTHGRTIWGAIFGIVLGIYIIELVTTAYTRRKADKSKIPSMSVGNALDEEKRVIKERNDL
jgi:hypothetical protein